ncbi:hypothetical protein ACJ5N2_17075 [Aeromonas salmonicida]|uniref:hypothetical protein n=1 Tax=Aeromonas salmonicida TaxID=645 RepID=UPI0038BB1FDD
MPLDSATYIKQMNPNNPVDTIDEVSLLGATAREMKHVLQNTFPNFDSQVQISSDKLNLFTNNCTLENGNQWYSGYDNGGGVFVVPQACTQWLENNSGGLTLTLIKA